MTRVQSVLVVDDEPSIRGLLDSMLRREGFEVHLAATADEALETFRRVELDVVITDVILPGMDGVTLLDELLELDADVPVLLMTGFGAIDAAVDAMRRGATDYITKPFKRQHVIESIERALARRKARDGSAPEASDPQDGGPKSFEESVLEFALENRMTLHEVGDLYIDRILSISRGNKVQAARALGINRRTLYRRGGAPKEREG